MTPRPSARIGLVFVAVLIGCATELHLPPVVGNDEVPAAVTPATTAPSPSTVTKRGTPVASRPTPRDAATDATDATDESGAHDRDEGGAPAEPGVHDGGAPTEVASDGGGSILAPWRAPNVPLRGVHLAGAEFGAPLPGVEGFDYEWPRGDEVDYFVAKGMNTFRIGFMWERVQARAYAGFEATYFAKLDALVRYATGKGAFVILDPHNFARYYDAPIGSAACPASVFADFWRRLALTYRHDAHVIFDLVNEPHDLPTEQWVAAANAAIAAIRATGATNLIQVPGNGWSGAHTWDEDWYGTPNAVALLDIVDPADNVVFEAHQYLDAEAGGESDRCVDATIGSRRLRPFLRWLRANGRKGFLGEFAGGANATCDAAIDDLLKTIEDSSDVMVGWVWWAAGPAWGPYPFTLEPAGGRDRPQMARLALHLIPP